MLGYDRDMRQMSCTYGGYVQNEWESERLNFVIGARIDKNNRIGNPVFSPRANIRYTPVRNVILRAGYTSGYRAPQAYDEDLHVNAVGGNVSLIDSRSRPQAGVLEQLHAVGRSLPQHGQGAAQPAGRRILHEPRRRILSRRAGARRGRQPDLHADERPRSDGAGHQLRGESGARSRQLYPGRIYLSAKHIQGGDELEYRRVASQGKADAPLARPLRIRFAERIAGEKPERIGLRNLQRQHARTALFREPGRTTDSRKRRASSISESSCRTTSR